MSFKVSDELGDYPIIYSHRIKTSYMVRLSQIPTEQDIIVRANAVFSVRRQLCQMYM